MNIKNLFVLLLPAFILIYSCKEDSVSNEGENHSITGTVTFLDGTPAAQAKVQLKNQTTSRLLYDTADVTGKYSFTDVPSGTYIIRFASPTYEVNSYISEDIVLGGSDIEHNFYITYKILDEQTVYRVNDSIVFIKFQPDGGKIGTNFDKILKMSGYYHANPNDSVSLSCLVYEIPAQLNWENPGIEITPEYIAQNFNFLFEADDSSQGAMRQIEFSGELIPIILSNPTNGFAFVNKSPESRRIEVPRVDRQNNDFGLLFEYQF